MISVITLCILGISASLEATNYCELPDSVCPSQLQHIACENNGDFSPKCGIHSVIEALSDTQKNRLLKEHNKFREMFASGWFLYLPEMKPKLILQWSDELAGIAQYIAKTCEKTFDKCYNTCHFPHSKHFVKNYAYNSEKSYFRNILKGIDYVNYQWRSAPNAFDFQLVIAEDQTHVGCGAVVYGTEEERNMQLVCNYGSSRTSCSEERNSVFLSLCNPEKSVFEELC